jgi:hypothetical protein
MYPRWPVNNTRMVEPSKTRNKKVGSQIFALG